VSSRAGLDDLEKRKFLIQPGLELRTLIVQPVASRCTDYATPVHISLEEEKKIKISVETAGLQAMTRTRDLLNKYK
jgi:hypothetical protein